MEPDWYPPNQLCLLAEAAKLAEHETPESAAFCEVGVYRGNSAGVLAHYRGNHELWLVDDLSLPGASRAEWPAGNGVIHCSSVDDTWPLMRLGLFHQDADHTEPVVSDHLHRLGQLVVVGGLIALHDFNGLDYPGVGRAWQNWVQCGDFTQWGTEGSLVIFIRRK